MLQENNSIKTILMGDMKPTISENRLNGDDVLRLVRKSKDKKVNKEGNTFICFYDNFETLILNWRESILLDPR